jgi:hypothetical protein
LASGTPRYDEAEQHHSGALPGEPCVSDPELGGLACGRRLSAVPREQG